MENNKIYTSVCIKGEDGYKHFGIHQDFAFLCGYQPSDVVKVNFKISDNQELNFNKNKSDYWGIFVFEEKRFIAIYPSYIQLNMYNPAGIEWYEYNKIGKAYRIEIIEEALD